MGLRSRDDPGEIGVLAILGRTAVVPPLLRILPLGGLLLTLFLERLFAHMSRFPGVKFVTMEEIADDFAKRFPRSGTARPQS